MSNTYNLCKRIAAIVAVLLILMLATYRFGFSRGQPIPLFQIRPVKIVQLNTNDTAISENLTAPTTCQPMRTDRINNNVTNIVPLPSPSSQYEYFRRRVQMNLQEFMHYTRAQLNNIKKMATEGQDISTKIDEVQAFLSEQHSSIMAEWKNMSRADGYDIWRQKESQNLSKLVQERLYFLQNPKDCAKVKKLLCRPEQNCGYGCHVHHLGFCLMVAYGLQRTFILDTKNWKYTNEGWERFFKPISSNCVDTGGQPIHEWNNGKVSESQVVHLPLAGYVNKNSYPPYAAVPEDILERLKRLHGDPLAWWAGQVLQYLQRPNPRMTDHFNLTAKKMGFEHPIVGIHVRRTDKNIEAAYHELKEYMAHVEEYYRRLERNGPVPVKRVFIATDEVRVLNEANQNYPDYVFVNNENFDVKSQDRYTTESLQRIITNLHFLSHSDFLVCTFSSNVCRLAYEMMQTLHVDASSYIQTLDYYYYFHGEDQTYLRDVAVYDHKPQRKGEIELHVGDTIRPLCRQTDGYTNGINDNGKHTGLYPQYKVDYSVISTAMPEYPDAKGFPTDL